MREVATEQQQLSVWVFSLRIQIWSLDIHKMMVYEFPVAAVTKYHKLGGLKQHKFIIWQFCRSEVSSGVTGLNPGVGRSISLSGCSERIHFLAFSSFWRLPLSLGSWLPSISSVSNSRLGVLTLHHSDFASVDTSSLSLSSTLRTLVIAMGPIR